MKFKKYQSINNTENKYGSTDYEQLLSLSKVHRIIATEKVDGCNFSFRLNKDDTLSFGKRTSLLQINSSFYSFQSVVEKYKNNVLALLKHIKTKYQADPILFGELFGGQSYQDKNGNKYKSKVKNINNRVDYTPEREFIAFDIYISSESISGFLPFADVKFLCEKFNIPVVPIVYEVDFDNPEPDISNIKTKINEMYGTNESANENKSLIEGVVIRSDQYNIETDPDGLVVASISDNRLIVKRINEKFSEKPKPSKKKIVADLKELSSTDQYIFKEILSYINKNRMVNVLSKIDESKHSNKKMIAGLLVQDAISDYKKDYLNVIDNLDKDIFKSIKKNLSIEALKLV